LIAYPSVLIAPSFDPIQIMCQAHRMKTHSA
jgi:hypothetical protein